MSNSHSKLRAKLRRDDKTVHLSDDGPISDLAGKKLVTELVLRQFKPNLK